MTLRSHILTGVTSATLIGAALGISGCGGSSSSSPEKLLVDRFSISAQLSDDDTLRVLALANDGLPDGYELDWSVQPADAVWIDEQNATVQFARNGSYTITGTVRVAGEEAARHFDVTVNAENPYQLKIDGVSGNNVPTLRWQPSEGVEVSLPGSVSDGKFQIDSLIQPIDQFQIVIPGEQVIPPPVFKPGQSAAVDQSIQDEEVIL